MNRFTRIAKDRIRQQNLAAVSGYRAGVIPQPGFPLDQQPSRRLCRDAVEDFCYMAGLRTGQREQRRRLRSGEMILRDGMAVFPPSQAGVDEMLQAINYDLMLGAA